MACKHGSDANGVGSLFRAQKRILQKRDTEAFALLGTLDGEAS